MQNLDTTAEELFNKIRGRFPSITIGDAEGNVTNEPKLGRYFDFDFVNEGRPIGKVSVSLDEKNVAVVYGGDLVATESDIAKKGWYDFLKELRMFARKRTLEFDTRDITKSNLDQRDYKFLAKNRDGDNGMNESKLYGTSRQSYQDFDGARLMIKHTEGVDQEASAGRTRKIGAIYVESSEGERFKYPFKHLTGARAMARHVSEGGVPHDDFGKHIVSMSEEMNKLRKFKSYMGRSAVMAESLSEYVDVVKQRVGTIKKTLESLQKPAYYKETFEAFETPVLEDVPTDVAENWIDQLTIKQFNEELADVFPYIYKLVSEANKAEEITAEDLLGEKKSSPAGGPACWDGKKIGNPKTKMKGGKRVNNCVPEGAEDRARYDADETPRGEKKKKVSLKKAPWDKDDEEVKTKEEIELEQGFEEMMGQFAEGETNEAQEGQVGTMALFVTDQDGGEHEVEVQVKIKNGKPEIDPRTLPGPEDQLYWDDADIEQQAMDAMRDGDIEFDEGNTNEEDYQPSKDDIKVYKLVLADAKKLQAEMKKAGSEDAEMMKGQMKDLIDIMHVIKGDRPEGVDTSANELMMDYYDKAGVEFKMPEGNAYAHAVKKAKMNGKKKGDEVDGPDGEKIKLEKEEQKTPLGEFILSYYDKEEGAFPKGETAVLTMVEKDYGEQYINPAKAFIESVYEMTERYKQAEDTNPEMDRMKELAGLR